MEYKEVQKIAKDTIEYAKKNIYAGMSLIEIREMCERKMLELGADSFWYWDIGAFVFAGDETTISVSGTKYKTSDRVILENDIITIDLSPQRENIWGDYARTLIIENGIVVDDEFASNEEWKNGVHMEKQLHKEMMHFVTPNTTFEELYYYMNKVIEDSGYINLDFMGNLGHSIVKQKNDRIYIEKGNKSKLDDVALFTFEPHISISGSKYGYKRENIYYFEDGRIKELSINTGALDDILPAIVIEKKIANRMEDGMNLVSFNTKEKAMPFVFDINGNIRYVLDISSTINKAYVGKEDNSWIVANDKAVFTFDILGKVLSTREPKYYAENENWKNGVLFREIQYLPKMNNQLAVYGFSDKLTYPSGVFSELGIDSKQELFKARLYFDRNSFEENNILSGRRIELF